MTQTFKDPVCDMDVTPETAAGTSEYQGTTYYFCSPGCKRSFDKEPEKYLGKDREDQKQVILATWPISINRVACFVLGLNVCILLQEG